MTQFQYSEKYLCGRVTKNLTPHRMHQNWFQIAHFNPMMHSFQMMYNTMGSKVDGLVVREHFLSKIA